MAAALSLSFQRLLQTRDVTSAARSALAAAAIVYRLAHLAQMGPQTRLRSRFNPPVAFGSI